MKLVARWAQVAAIEVRICQVRAPFWVLLPHEILRAMTAGRSCVRSYPLPNRFAWTGVNTTNECRTEATEVTEEF